MKNKILLSILCLLLASCAFNEEVNPKLNILQDFENGKLENTLIVPPQHDLRPEVKNPVKEEEKKFFEKEYITE